jgi:hypothetical protein
MKFPKTVFSHLKNVMAATAVHYHPNRDRVKEHRAEEREQENGRESCC